jgi:hypothetical protein
MASHGRGKLIELHTGQTLSPPHLPTHRLTTPIKNMAKTEMRLKKTEEMLMGKNKMKRTLKLGELLS